MHVLLLRGVSLLSVQVTRWGEWRVCGAGCDAGAVGNSQSTGGVPKWQVGDARKCYCNLIGKPMIQTNPCGVFWPTVEEGPSVRSGK